ncbi:hypothetical protein HK100_008205 [Physocladia obscura]|uniref:Carbohydrate esterase family 16 protein n=1 Tax=Physocladia obscura TaxID=109957 RepID=A0AAD5SN44_9FUNG|nr:hypothetical protein HK100_008205 [Physocladia obscura]
MSVAGTGKFNFHDISRLFVFGDSYTATGFNISGTQPSDSNILGNPPFPGWSWPNGGNWLTELVSVYNKTTTFTYNLAYGGATTNKGFIPPYASTVLCLDGQVQTEFLPVYAGNGIQRVWDPKETLFAIWIGVNDVGWSSGWSNMTDPVSRIKTYNIIISYYTSYVQQLYNAGARNFLFLNCPATYLSPSASSNSAFFKVLNQAYNSVLYTQVTALFKKLPYANYAFFDTFALFEQVYFNAQSYGITNLTGYATQVTPNYPYNQSYFWLDALHPNTVVHKVISKTVAEQVFGV